jgi:transcription elongation factor GreA
MSNKTFLTKEGFEKLQNEINELKTVGMKECIEAIAEARDKGDLSENAEYDAAKEHYDNLNTKINKLTVILTNAVIISTESIKCDVVQILTTVKCRRKDKKEVSYTIVPHVETDIKNGKISVNSPVAQSLIGKAKGDLVKVNTPSGELELEILDIKI